VVAHVDDDADLELFSPVVIRTLHKNLILAGRTCKEACDMIIVIMDTYEAHKDWSIKRILDKVWKDYTDCEE
jgi:hypothetical protein